MTRDEALSLQEHDSQEHFHWPPSERKIVVHPYDLSLQTLVDQWDTDFLYRPNHLRAVEHASRSGRHSPETGMKLNLTFAIYELEGASRIEGYAEEAAEQPRRCSDVVFASPC